MPYLEVNGISLEKTGAWHAGRSLARLLSSPPKRNNNQTLPYVDGQIDFDQQYDQAIHDLSVNVQGFKDYAGAAHSSHSAGLVANTLYLRTNVFSLKTTVPAVFH